jgi:hypothetical protein
LLWDVISNASKYLIPFSAIIVIVLLAFSFSAHWLFGQELNEFHTMTNTFATMLHIITDGYDYQAMRNVAPVGAPLWCTCWVGLSSIVLLNMFIAILVDSYTFVQTRSGKVDEVTQAYRSMVPSWALYLRMKIFRCFAPRDEDVKERVVDLRHSTTALRQLFDEVNKVDFWTLVLRNVAEGSYTIEPQDLLPLFQHHKEPQVAAEDWLTLLATHGRIPYVRGEDESNAVMEMRKLTLMVNRLEKDLYDLSVCLDVADETWHDNAIVN